MIITDITLKLYLINKSIQNMLLKHALTRNLKIIKAWNHTCHDNVI